MLKTSVTVIHVQDVLAGALAVGAAVLAVVVGTRVLTGAEEGL